jgi:hypothetical protein
LAQKQAGTAIFVPFPLQEGGGRADRPEMHEMQGYERLMVFRVFAKCYRISGRKRKSESGQAVRKRQHERVLFLVTIMLENELQEHNVDFSAKINFVAVEKFFADCG